MSVQNNSTLVSFRPNYGNKAVLTETPVQKNVPPIQPVIASLAKDIFINHRDLDCQKTTIEKTKLDYDKILTSQIINIKKRTHFYLNNYFSLIKPETFFNSFHWVTWFTEISNFDIKSLNETEKNELKNVFGRFLGESKNLRFSAGENALLTLAFSTLKKHIEIPEALTTLLYKNSLLALPNMNIKELTIFLRGCKFFYSNKQQLTFYEKILTVCDLERFNQTGFHTRVSFLSAFSHLEIFKSHPFTWNSYVESTEKCLKKEIKSLDIKDILTFLYSIQNQKTSDSVKKLIEHIEIVIMNSLEGNNFQTPQNKIITITRALKGFAVCSYLPKRLLPQILVLLKDSKTPIWEKMTCYDSLSMLGYKEILPQLKIFVETEINKTHQLKQCPIYETIYGKELFSLLHAIACIYPESEQLPVIIEKMVARLLKLIKFLPNDLKMGVGEVCCALGYIDEGKPLLPLPEVYTGKISPFQEKITSIIKGKLKSKPDLNSVKIIEELDVGGRNIDLVLSKNELKIACEIDSYEYHFCINDAKRYLGSNILRNKFLSKIGYEVFPLIANENGFIDEPQYQKIINRLQNS